MHFKEKSSDIKKSKGKLKNSLRLQHEKRVSVMMRPMMIIQGN